MTDVVDAISTVWNITFSYFRKLTKKERLDLCIAVKDHLKLDGMKSNTDENSFFPLAYTIMDKYGNKKDIVAMACRTVPTVHLKLGISKDNLVIMIARNRFLADESYAFHIETVGTNPIPCKECE